MAYTAGLMTTTTMDAPLMTALDVAAYLKVHVKSVRIWANSGELRGTFVGAGTGYRFRLADVDAFLENRPIRRRSPPPD